MGGISGGIGGAPAGYEWNQAKGGYTPIQSGRQTYEDQNPYSQGRPSADSASDALAVAQQRSGGADYTVGSTGEVQYSNKSMQDRQSEAQRLAALKEARDSFLSVTGGSNGGSAPTVANPNVQSNEQDARSAAFARAKDQAGKISRASLTSIAENMASRGTSGSGIEALRSAGAINGADEPLQELTRDQAISDTNRAADISDMTYSGAITQRGQDLASRSSYLNLLRSLY